MKSSLLLLSIATFATAFSSCKFLDWETEAAPTTSILPPVESDIIFNQPALPARYDAGYSNFFYGLGTRFQGITKAELRAAKTYLDFIEPQFRMEAYKFTSTNLVIVENDRATDHRAEHTAIELNPAQLALLAEMDYSTNFSFRGTYEYTAVEVGKFEVNYFNPYYTVVPAKQASYLEGKEALIDYLKAGNQENTFQLDESKLQPAKLYFTVTAQGNITNVRLDQTSGYAKIDDRMKTLMQNLSGKWSPAEDVDGNLVEQELVISFGMVGC